MNDPTLDQTFDCLGQPFSSRAQGDLGVPSEGAKCPLVGDKWHGGPTMERVTSPLTNNLFLSR